MIYKTILEVSLVIRLSGQDNWDMLNKHEYIKNLNIVFEDIQSQMEQQEHLMIIESINNILRWI